MRATARVLTLFIIVAFVLPGAAGAGIRYGDLDISGNIRSTNLVRHQAIDNLGFIMQRNTTKLRLEWKWLQRGKAFGKYSVPWLKRSDIYGLVRGVYDSVYDFTPGMIERKDLQGDPISPRAASLDTLSESARDALKFNLRFRELYIDLYMKHIPLTLRIGKQQIVWGETDGFRMNDRANTLDLSWHFFQEFPPPGFGFDDLRQPFFMIKGLWDFRQLGPLSQPFLEFYWNPGDWNPGKVAFLPRPWGVRLLDPLKNSLGTGALQSASLCPFGECVGLLNGTKLFKQGTWKRNPLENSQFGVRFHFITERGLEWTVNYLYQRWSPDGSPTAIVRGLPADGFTTVNINGVDTLLDNETFCSNVSRDPNNPFTQLIAPYATGEGCVEYFAPYIHSLGASLNYFESEYTQTVWRLESLIDFDLPFYDGDKQTALLGRSPNGPILLPGITERSMWKGMIAFDRPTWIRSLNKKTTFFVTGQFFWHYIIDHKRRRCAIDDDPANGFTSSPGENCGSDTELLLPGEQWGLVGPLDLPKLSAPAGKGRDTIHQWELLGTLAVLGFYKGGSLVPALIYLVDPVNSFAQELAIGIDWFIRPDLTVNWTTKVIWVGAPWDPYDGHQSDSDVDNGELFEPWFLGGGSRGRSESGLQVTWQF
ncbi:MAG: DUF1302 family protein [Candidatus Binatia bacterium]